MTHSVNKNNSGQVLVIEDNPDHWVMMQNALVSLLPGVETIRTVSHETTEAFLNECMAQGRYPHLIILDLYLPDREVGLSILRKIRQLASPGRKIPILVLSNSNHREDILQSYDLGANSYIIKPLNLQEWLPYFQAVTEYWWQSVTLPRIDPY
ncbi:response regulator [Larkinella soli]|uniref:response regulator n=1 Tax=Larkinella soli TaxID=1770527 RepID=UPI000FFC0FB8|nr:response regulator [Larkinella soli]